MALFGPRAMSDLSPQCAAERTSERNTADCSRGHAQRGFVVPANLADPLPPCQLRRRLTTTER